MLGGQSDRLAHGYGLEHVSVGATEGLSSEEALRMDTLSSSMHFFLGPLPVLVVLFPLYRSLYRPGMALHLGWSCCWSSVERIRVLLHSDSIAR